MFLRVFIPRYHHVEGQQHQHVADGHGGGGGGRSHFVYLLEVSTPGKFFRVERRYSQFLTLHNELRKLHRTPEFPPKKLRNTSSKVLEQRRQGLELYVQHFARMTQVPKVLLDFLEVPKEEVVSSSFAWEKPSHQPVAGFTRDPFLVIQSSNDRLPDIVTQATLDFFYK